MLAGALFGLSVHLKIYPIIYGFPLILFIDRTKGEINRWGVLFNPSNWFTRRKIKFFGTSALVFFGLGYVFYQLYGDDFVYETYLYHYFRKDHRHNFSFNFYFEYLHYEELPETPHLIRRLSFVAQWGLVSFVGIRFYYDFLSAIFLQTYLFVMFNRVITAQYFVWFMALLPLIAIKTEGLLRLRNIVMVFMLFLLSELMVNLA